MTTKKRIIHVGIDVSKDTLSVAWRGLRGQLDEFEVPNTPAGHRKLHGRVGSGKNVSLRIGLEATGSYGTTLVMWMAEQPRTEVMVINPGSVAAFAKATNQRAKTDRLDAQLILEFVVRVGFQATVFPPQKVLQIRKLSRHMCELIDRRTALKNQRHAESVADSDTLEMFLDAEESVLDKLIGQLETRITEELCSLEGGERLYQNVVALKGIKARTAARVLPELLAMPQHLTPAQAVAFVGLDPRIRTSGTSRSGTSFRISKRGNSRIRRALYLSTLIAVRYNPPLKAYYDRLIDRGKPKKVALVACMRKLLTALWAMTTRDEPFCERRFGYVPA